VVVSFFFSFLLSPPLYFSWCVTTFSGNRPGRRAKGSLHRAAKRGLRQGKGLYIARHDLDRSHTRIMNKQKKKKKKSYRPVISPVWVFR